MKRIMQTAAAAMFVVAAFSPAQALVIGTANSENGRPFSDVTVPSWFNQAYNASDFASPISISSITFYDSFGATGGVGRTDTFRLWLSKTSSAIGSSAIANFPAGATIVYQDILPTLANGRLQFDLTQVFNYNPGTDGNLVVTIQPFLDGSANSANPLRLDFMSVAGTTAINALFSVGDQTGTGGAGVTPFRGFVTGFNDVAAAGPSATPVPAVGAGVPLVIGAAAMFRRWRRRKAA